MVLLKLKIFQFNPDLQVISQSTSLTIGDTGVGYILIKMWKEDTSVVIFPLFFINLILVILNRDCLQFPFF
jgi:hypothetical protein